MTTNKDNYHQVRANGGFLTHYVKKGETTALCGHKPIGRRGRWVKNLKILGMQPCSKCQKKLEALSAKSQT